MNKRLVNIAGWAVFAIATIVYYLTAERTGSLWDCGEFIAGAYKLEVVHPPGAPFFLLVGRMFTWVAEILSDNPENIAFAVNFMSGIVTAFAAMLVAWSTMILGKMIFVGREGTLSESENYAVIGGGFLAGITTAFCSSIWFSAVEGEVYAMSLTFTCLTLWAVMKWYNLPDTAKADRWLVFAVYSSALSIGVHLLSLLTFPALAIFYYFKKYKKHNFLGIMAAAAAGVALIGIIQTLVITGIPILWSQLELLTVNNLGMPFYSGLVPLLLILGTLSYFAIRFARQKGSRLLEMLVMGLFVTVIGYSTFGVVVIRAEADTPINMNAPSDAMRLIPYLNREQYGERALLNGPSYEAGPSDTKIVPRYGRLGDKYAIVDEKVSYVYDKKDKMFFPRMSDGTQGRPAMYKAWANVKGSPGFADNVAFLWKYQIGWMYMRYFFWNFVGRQNGDQGIFKWNKKDGHWLSGISFIDEARLYNMDKEPSTRVNAKGRNKYYAIPLIFGLLGLFFHFYKRPNDALGLFALFIITGIGIIIYSNQPPAEPRERDYVLVGSFFTFSMWIGMGAMALFHIFRSRANLGGTPAAALGCGLVALAPLLMVTQNFDDHSRNGIYASRDYASNFLNSCEENAIIFTYGDNDTYPLWYAQEVEGIRTDVRVVNLSLIAVDWYIDQMRRKVNNSPPIKMQIPATAIRGKKRNSILYRGDALDGNKEWDIYKWLEFIGDDNPQMLQNGRKTDSFLPARKVYIPIDKKKIRANNIVSAADTAIVNRIPVRLTKDPSKFRYLLKDDIAVLDIIANNIHERPVYFAVTCRPDNMFGLEDYMQLEGLALRVIPVKSQSASRNQYSTMGNGRVAHEQIYDNIVNKWKWGNFDKKEVVVNHSYGPSVQSHRVTIMRAAESFLALGDKQKAIDLIDKYFEGFPQMNFPYDYNTYGMADIYVKAGKPEKAKPIFSDLADETLEHLDFYQSIDPSHTAGQDGFGRDKFFMERTMSLLMRSAQEMKDAELMAKFTTMFSAHQTTKPLN